MESSKEEEKCVNIVVVGLGQRGVAYSEYSLDFPLRMKVVGIAEPRDHVRLSFAEQYEVPSENCFTDWRDLVLKDKFAEGVIIALQDQLHADCAVEFAKKGYHILLEKPMAVTIPDCRRIVESAIENNVLLSICHVLRYTPWNQKIKDLIESGAIGTVANIQHYEPVGYYHFAHSYVRGPWANEDKSTFSLMAKCCHDIDLIYWWMNQKCTDISSFGSLFHFKKENQPAEAKDNCLICPLNEKCPYSAKRLYIDYYKSTGHLPFGYHFEKTDIESVEKALETGPFGKCAYTSENNVCDNQVVNMFFQNGSTATLTMSAFTEKVCERQVRITGSLGEIRNEGAKVSLYLFEDEKETVFNFTEPEEKTRLMGHLGADYYLMKAFIQAIASKKIGLIKTSGEQSLQSHLLVFAAELARKEKRVVETKEFELNS